MGLKKRMNGEEEKLFLYPEEKAPPPRPRKDDSSGRTELSFSSEPTSILVDPMFGSVLAAEHT